jgi:hypothetical protein
MTECIELNILKEPCSWQACECFLCFDECESKYIHLKCCNRNNIHIDCLFNIFIHYMHTNKKNISCPLCRQQIYIKDYFSLDECITLFSNFNDIDKQKFFEKFQNIILHNFINENHTLQIDETRSIVSIIRKKSYNKYIITFVAIIYIVFIIVIFEISQR